MSKPIWTLQIDLEQYTPAETDRMTGASAAMQRDWRHRGIGPIKREKHSRFTIFDVAEIYALKAFSDQGKGPSQSAAFAARVGEEIVAAGAMWRGDAWSGEKAEDIFSRIPVESRQFTHEERSNFDNDQPIDHDTWNEGRRQWVVNNLYQALKLAPNSKWGHQAIWWPTGALEFGEYEFSKFQGLGGDGKFSKVDPKFDGAAVVLNLEAAAEILVDRAPRPWFTAKLVVDDAAPIKQRTKVPRNLGDVVVTRGGERVGLYGRF